MNSINSANELRDYLNKEYGVNKEWPRTFIVNSKCYADCCQEVFNWTANNRNAEIHYYFMIFEISLGRETNGLMFKNVELILDKTA